MSESTGKIVLGRTYTDCITGFKGVAVSRVEYLTGCDQIGLNPGLGADGKLMDVTYFDWTRLKELSVRAVELPGRALAKKTGGPNDAAPGRQG